MKQKPTRFISKLDDFLRLIKRRRRGPEDSPSDVQPQRVNLISSRAAHRPTQNHIIHPSQRFRSGFTLAETALATLLVGMLVVGSLQSLTASFRTHQFAQNRVRATFLAEQLLVEISSLRWADPHNPSTARTIGRDSGDPEVVAQRSQLDDMDDFDNWTELPPADRDGAALRGVGHLRRSITVDNISATDPAVTVADDADTGVRRITVTVADGDQELARVSTLVTRAELSLRSSVEEQTALPNIPAF